jgi:hypothetical protein
VGEQVCVVGTFWLKDVDAAGRANQTGGEHGVQADVTANIDECVTRLQEPVHRQARFGLVELPGSEAVEHKPLTEELGGELQNDFSFQTGAIDGKARCDRGHGNSSSCSRDGYRFCLNTATMACTALTARASLTGALL